MAWVAIHPEKLKRANATSDRSLNFSGVSRTPALKKTVEAPSDAGAPVQFSTFLEKIDGLRECAAKFRLVI
jgi:hypothetical protein